MTRLPPAAPLALAALVLATPAGSQEFRAFRRIPTPRRAAPGTATAAPPAAPVDRPVVDAAVAQLAKAWTNRKLDDQLAESFQQRDRLRETSELRVPRDATMQVESTRNVQTLSQRLETGPDGRTSRVSVVTATVATRLICNDPTAGFVQVPGENEVVFEIVEEVR